MYFELPDSRLILFSGPDAESFLHNQLTCDVAALVPGGSTYGGYCSPKGRLLATFLLWRSEQGYFMQLPASLRDPIQKQLSKFILRSKVKATDVSGDWAIIGVAGKNLEALVQRVTSDAMVVPNPSNRYEVVAARDKSPKVLESLASGTEKSDTDNWEWLDIRDGIPTILPATQEEFVPQMVNLDLIGGVSFEKGCYPGQEIVARMHYRGTLKQRMYRANVPGPDRPQPGEKLYSPAFGDQACGTIVNAASSSEGGSDVLAVVQIAAAGKSDVRLKSANGAVVSFLPSPYPMPAQE